MNMVSVMKYYWRCNKLAISVFCLVTIASMLLNTAALVRNTRTVTTMPNAQGVITQHVSYSNLAFQSNLGRLNNAAPFGLLATLFALATIKKDREFLVSCSVPRYRIWLGTCAFLILLSAALAVMSGLIAPALCRAGLMAIQFPMEGGWQSVPTGNDPHVMRTILITAMSSIGTAGCYMLIGYLFARWWKVILIGFGVLLVTFILLANMVRWQTYLAEVMANLSVYIEDFMRNIVPQLQAFFSEENRMRLTLYQLGIGCICMLLSYPVMRGMKVV